MKFNSFDSVETFTSVLNDILNYHLPHYLDVCCYISVSDIYNDLFDVKLHFECDEKESNFLIHFIDRFHLDHSENLDCKFHYSWNYDYDLYFTFFNLDLSTCGYICILFNNLISYLEYNEVI